MNVREGQRWKRDLEDGEIVLIERVWQGRLEDKPEAWTVRARPVEPECSWEPWFLASPEFIEARYTLLS